MELDGDRGADKDGQVDDLLDRIRRKEGILKRAEALHEQNPMLGLRGVRLGLVIEGLYEMQVKALAEEAAIALPAPITS